MATIDDLLPLFLAACAQTDAEACAAMLEYRADYPGVESPFVGTPNVLIRCGAGYVDEWSFDGRTLGLSVRSRGSAVRVTMPVDAIVSFGMRYARTIDPARAADAPPTEPPGPATPRPGRGPRSPGKNGPKLRLV